MSYFKPYIDETGYHYPTYNDILEYLINRMQTIYGTGIYLGNDSPDYEMLSTFAELTYDAYQAGEMLYDSQSTETAMGVGLDYKAALNGIARKTPTQSSVVLTLSGTAGTVISGGVVADNNGHLWDIPDDVTLESTGSGTAGAATVTAYCREYGAISALANTVTRIMTPMIGWTGATNSNPAVLGVVAEKDSELRARCKASTGLPSVSLKDGLRSALLAAENVTRAVVYENDTNATDADGIPAHSVYCVVEGGDDNDIGEIIRVHKGTGCGTYGAKNITVYDHWNQPATVHFDALSKVLLDVAVTVTTRTGYSATTTPEAIRLAIINYLEAFDIGTDVSAIGVWSAAQSANEDLTKPTFAVTAVTICKHSGTPGISDIAIGLKEIPYATAQSITVTAST